MNSTTLHVQVDNTQRYNIGDVVINTDGKRYKVLAAHRNHLTVERIKAGWIAWLFAFLVIALVVFLTLYEPALDCVTYWFFDGSEVPIQSTSCNWHRPWR